MENDFSYMLTFSNLVLKLNNQQDCTEECEEIRTLSQEDQVTIINQLLSMIDKNNAKSVENIISALKKINYLDPLYVDDYVSVVEMKAGLKEFEDMNIIVACYDTEKLGDAYESIRDVKLQPYKSNQQTIISSIEKYLKSL